MASILKVDDLRGNTAAADVTVTDGSVTMKLQDGLAVVGINHDLTNNTIKQSFNVSSVSDIGTGNQFINYTNLIATSETGMYMGSNGTYGDGEVFGSGTGGHYQRIRDTGGTLIDSTQTHSTTHGDLA